MMKNDPCYVYFLECVSRTGRESIYIGCSGDVEDRFKLHVKGRGALYTSKNKPLEVLATLKYPNRKLAMRVERSLKKLPSSGKRVWLSILATTCEVCEESQRKLPLALDAGESGRDVDELREAVAELPSFLQKRVKEVFRVTCHGCIKVEAVPQVPSY